ncbi:MAG: C-GCAxxG-C-C family protein [Eubacteriales bacterium]|nr:C-GCAxxG-C-C family protein [Eubacteriales bacterium]
MNEEMFELRLKGYCCSQIIMELGLRRLDKENPDLIAAMAGLCNGLWQGKICGILSAAICLLYLADPEEAARFNAAAFSEWFEDAFGSTECDVLMEGNPLNRAEKCPAMLEASFMKVCELLEWE